MTHLDYLQLRLSNARIQLAQARPSERDLLAVFVAQAEREVEGELKFLARPCGESMSDDEILADLLEPEEDEPCPYHARDCA